MPATIQLGSVGPDVSKWQKLLGAAGFPVSVTGNFDALTDELTRAWQKAKGLLIDGIVGPASWGAMTGQAVTTNSAAADKHRIGREVIRRAWPTVTGREANLAELQIAGANADLESNYGRASYKLLDHSTGAVLATSGVINNWGAVQTSDPAKGFLATDTSPLKQTPENPKGYYDHHYRVYATPEEGAAEMIRQMTTRRPTSWKLMAAGDIDGWAEAMHARPGKVDPESGVPGYFEQAPSSRAKGIADRIAQIAAAHGEPVAAKRGGAPITLPGGAVVPAAATGLLTLGALGAALWYLWKVWKGG